MNKQKGFTLVEGFLIVLILSVVGFAGYYVWNQNKNGETELDLPKPSFSDGQFVVGTDIQAGTYFVSALSGCYWERQADFEGGLNSALELEDDFLENIDSIIANELVRIDSGQFIVTIEPSDAGFLSRDCGDWYDISLMDSGFFDAIPDGIYVVSTQIEPGTYKASKHSKSCYWERMTDFKSENNDSIIEGDIGSKSTVTILESDAGFKSLDCGTWIKQ
jgi:hypothetical protein